MKWLLPREMMRKGIPWTPHYRKFINIRKIFMEYFPHSGYHIFPGLKFMSKFFNIPIENHHSGIGDCRTIAKVVTRMLENGANFVNFEELSEDFDPCSVNVKDFNLFYTRDQLTVEKLAYIMDLEDNLEGIVGLYYLPWLGYDGREHNFIFIVKDYLGIQNKFSRNNMFVYSSPPSPSISSWFSPLLPNHCSNSAKCQK
eukprot:TRINITY_DN7700_c0_g2_i5.p1 TRINITY_DN7700_c0_g2~~TRINITY_DN7700_c0_g2_i5.p1  ORF type:complete len:199 (+),score=40.99 TRINITY_DN7700_c0_g2_i5:518-1114(+)